MTGTTAIPSARCRAAIASVCSGSKWRRITTVLAIVAARTRQPNPHAWNIGAATTTVSSARHGTRSMIATRSPAPPPVPRRAPFGAPVVPLVSSTTCGLLVGAGGPLAEVVGDQPVDGEALGRLVLPGDHVHRPLRQVGQRFGVLLVVDQDVDVLAAEQLGQLRPGERGVEQHQVGAELAGGDQRLDEAAVVAGQQADPAASVLEVRRERGGQRVGALLELAPRHRTALVDQRDPLGSPGCRQAGAGHRGQALAPDRAGHPQVLVRPQRPQQPGPRDHPRLAELSRAPRRTPPWRTP